MFSLSQFEDDYGSSDDDEAGEQGEDYDPQSDVR